MEEEGTYGLILKLSAAVKKAMVEAGMRDLAAIVVPIQRMDRGGMTFGEKASRALGSASADPVGAFRAGWKISSCRTARPPELVAGFAITIWIFLRPDGGVVRVNPRGDPTNPWRTQAQVAQFR